MSGEEEPAIRVLAFAVAKGADLDEVRLILDGTSYRCFARADAERLAQQIEQLQAIGQDYRKLSELIRTYADQVWPAH